MRRIEKANTGARKVFFVFFRTNHILNQGAKVQCSLFAIFVSSSTVSTTGKMSFDHAKIFFSKDYVLLPNLSMTKTAFIRNIKAWEDIFNLCSFVVYFVCVYMFKVNICA